MEKSHNILRDIHLIMTDAPVIFRQEVCKECGYAVPTYYRKKRPSSRTKRNVSKEKLSTAEKKAIWEQGDKVVKKLTESLNALRKHIQ